MNFRCVRRNGCLCSCGSRCSLSSNWLCCCRFCCGCSCNCGGSRCSGSCCYCCCCNWLIHASFLEITIQQVSPVFSHIFIARFIRVYTVVKISLIVYNAVDISKPYRLAFVLHLQNEIVNRGIVAVNATGYSFHQLLLFCIRAAPCIDAVSSQPVSTQDCINIWNRRNVNDSIAVQVLQDHIDQIFQTIGNAVIVFT